MFKLIFPKVIKNNISGFTIFPQIYNTYIGKRTIKKIFKNVLIIIIVLNKFNNN